MGGTGALVFKRRRGDCSAWRGASEHWFLSAKYFDRGDWNTRRLPGILLASRLIGIASLSFFQSAPARGAGSRFAARCRVRGYDFTVTGTEEVTSGQVAVSWLFY